MKSAWIWTVQRNLIYTFLFVEIAHVLKSLGSLWKPGKQQTWRLILRWRKFPPSPSPSPFNACHAGYSDDQTLQPTIKMTPGFKTFTLCILLIQLCKGVPGPPIPRLLVIVFFLVFFQSDRPTDRPTQYQETHSTLNEKKGGGMALAEITNYKLWEDCDGDWNGRAAFGYIRNRKTEGKTHPKPQNRKTIRPKPKTAYKTVKDRYNGDKWGIQSKLN